MRIVLKNSGGELEAWNSVEELVVAIIREQVVFEEGDRIEFEPDDEIEEPEPEFTVPAIA